MIKRILLSIVLVAAMLLPTVAFASPVPGGPWAGSWDVQTKTRWGQTGYESELRSPGGNPNINPAGTPVWVVGSYYPFELTYTVATGVATWKIDFNIDGDFGDPQESVSTTSPTLVGYSFRYLNLWMNGYGTSPNCSAVDVKNFTVNGTNLGNFATTCGASPAVEWTWTDTGGFFRNLTITGQYRITGTPGTTQETNRMWIRLGDQVAVPALLEATTTDALICTGETTTVNFDLADVVGLYGYQFQVSYDATKASASGAFVNSFFDTNTNGSVPPGWGAVCSGGVCKFAKSEVAPDPAVSGSGTLAQITLTGAVPGTFNMAITSDVLSDINGAALPHNVGAPLPITVCGLATVDGYVTLQGRPVSNVDTGTVSLIEQGTNFTPPGVTPVTFSNGNGSYSFAGVPFMPGGSSYQIVAEHGLYLDNQEIFTVSGNVTNKNTRLWGGDANNDGDVTIADLSCIGGDFGGPPNTCSGTSSSDINADGTVNIQDLSLAGGNYDKCGAQPWAWNTATPVYCPP